VENKRIKKGFFAKIFQVFSTVEKETKKNKSNKEEFLHSVNEIARDLLNYEKINTKVDKDVLNKISQAVNKNKFYDNKGELLPSAITNLPIFEEEGKMELEINKMITEETKTKLESLKKQHDQEKIIAKFDQEKFSFFKRPKLK